MQKLNSKELNPLELPLRVAIDQGVNHKILKKLVRNMVIIASQVHDLEAVWPFTAKHGNGFRVGISKIGSGADVGDYIVGDDWFNFLRLMGVKNHIDAAHVYFAAMSGNQYFLTANPKDFIANGKRELIEEALTIRVYELDEFIAHLEDGGVNLSFL